MRTRSFVLFGILAAAPAAAAQTVRGVVFERDSVTPARGIIVALIDSAGTNIARTLTRVDGRYGLSAPAPGRYRVRALRVGFRSVTTPEFSLAVDDVVERNIVFLSAPISLTSITVTANQACRASQELGPAFALWEEIRKALTAAIVAREAKLVSMVFRTYNGTRQRPGDSIRIEEIQTHAELVDRPFESIGVERLAKQGYIEGEQVGSRAFAPDEDVLLSDHFASTHCFGLSNHPIRSNLIGLTFEPVKRTERRSDIRGTLWVDRETAALQWLDFSYTNPPPEGQWTHAGGRLDFEQLPNGTWVIPHWSIQMPPGSGHSNELLAVGGILAEVRGDTADRSSVVWRHPRRSTQGVVRDTATGKPIPFATVSVSGTPFSTKSDSTGRFVLEYEFPATYAIDAHAPLFDSIGSMEPETYITLADSAPLELHAMESVRFIAQKCGSGWLRERGVMFGIVFDDRKNSLVGRARIIAQWDTTVAAGTTANRPTRETRSERSGLFVLCNLPLDSTLQIDVNAGSIGRTNFPVVVNAPSRYAFRRLIFNARK
jgi:hypothetical protein